MDRKKMIAILTGGFLALIIAFGAFTYSYVHAQSATTTPSFPGRPGFGRGMKGGYTDQDLANALGIGLDQLQTAQKTAFEEALKQAVADGVITQAQADQFSQNYTNGRPFFGLPFIKDSNIDYNALLAKALGISTDQLNAAYQKAFEASLSQAVQNGTITQQQADLIKARNALVNDSKFQSTMRSAYEAAVNQAVADGVISQSQADQLLQDSAGMMFGGPGGFGHQGGWGRGRFGVPPAQANPPTSSPTSAP